MPVSLSGIIHHSYIWHVCQTKAILDHPPSRISGFLKMLLMKLDTSANTLSILGTMDAGFMKMKRGMNDRAFALQFEYKERRLVMKPFSLQTEYRAIGSSRYIEIQLKTRPVTGHFSVKVDLTQFRKYHSLRNRQVKHIGVEHLLLFRIRNELQFAKARKVISLEFPPFATLTQVKLSCRNTNGYGSYNNMTNAFH